MAAVHCGASGLGLCSRPAAPRLDNLPATRPAPALVMAGEVGPTALALAKVVMVMATTMVGLLEGGLSPPDSSRDGTDFRHFPATTDEKGEQLKLFPFSYFHFQAATQMYFVTRTTITWQ